MTPSKLFETFVESAMFYKFQHGSFSTPIERCLARGVPIPDEHLPGRLLQRLLANTLPEHRPLIRELTGAMTVHRSDTLTMLEAIPDTSWLTDLKRKARTTWSARGGLR